MSVRRVVPLVGAALLLQLAFYGLLVGNVVANLRGGALDVLAFYTAGRIVRMGQLDQLYQLDLQRDIQQAVMGSADFISGGVLPFNHPPIVALLAALVADQNLTTMYLGWFVLLAVCLVPVAWFARDQLRGMGRTAWLAALGLMLLYPLFISLLKGQDTALVVLGAALGTWGIYRDRPNLAGAGFALLWIKPQLALAFAVPLLISRHRALVPWMIVSALLAGLSLLLVGIQGARDFLAILQLSASSDGYGMNPAQMINLGGLLLRAAPGLDRTMVDLLKWTGFLLGIAGLSWLWWRRGVNAAVLGATAALAPVVAPHAHFHDLALLLLPLLALTGWLHEHERPAAALLLVPLCSLLLLAGSVAGGFWQYLPAYLLPLALVVACVAIARPAGGIGKTD